ncbi:MAG: hypothetical protein MI919_25860 [Holophagales bacterium]|nr:hypothetical protein [Holophagales bacterium]
MSSVPAARALCFGLLAGLLSAPAVLAGSPQIEIERRETSISSPIFRDAVPGPPSRWVGEPISLSLKDADLVEVLRSFAQLGEFNLIVQPGVMGRVTVELKEVPWDQALSAILKMHGLGMDISRGTVRIGERSRILQLVEQEGRSGSSLAERQVIRGRLEHADPGLVAQVLNRLDLGILSRVGYATEQEGSLIVAELPARISRVARLVARLDAPGAASDPEALARRALELWNRPDL